MGRNGYDGLTEKGDITLLNGKVGVWDYFITDYQQNVGMILTEETHQAVNTCTRETTNNRPTAEDPVFGQPGAANEVETTRYPTPSGWQSVNSSLSVSRDGWGFGIADAGEGTIKNSYLYNDKELFDDGDLNWDDYGFRNYDPQIGRFP